MLTRTMPGWFDRMVLRRLYCDLEFYGRLMPIMGVAADGSEVRDFDNPIHQALFSVLANYSNLTRREAYDVGAHYETVWSLLGASAQQGKLIRMQEMQPAIEQLHSIVQIPMETAVQATNEYICTWLVERRAKHLGSLMQMGSLSADQHYQLLSHERTRIFDAMKEKASMQMFGWGLDNPPPNVPRMVTGFKSFDRTTGGLGATESTLIAACSGVGKTAAATQFSSQVVLFNPSRRVLHIFTEQTQADMERRIVSQCCRVPFNMTKDGLNYDELSAPQMDSLRLIRLQLEKRLCLMRWQHGTSIKEGILQTFREASKRMGGPPDLTVLDWIGGAIAESARPEDIRHLYQEAADNMVYLGENEGCATLSFAQAAEKEAMNKLHVDSRALRECKSMHVKMTNMIGITAFMKSAEDMAEEGAGGQAHAIYKQEQFFYLSKSRKAQNTAIPVIRNMNYQRFEDKSFQQSR